MPDRDSQVMTPPLANHAAPKRRMHWRWQWLVAPLMGASVILHIALLFVPIPASDLVPEAEEEEPPPEEETLEILSLSEIPLPESPAEQPDPEPQPEAAPPAGGEPPPPTLDQVDDVPTEEDPITEDEPPPEDDTGTEDGNFQRRERAAAGRRNILGSEFGSVNANTELIVETVAADWPTGLDQACFVSDLNPNIGITPASGGLDALYIARNVAYIAEDLCNSGFCTAAATVGDYCGAPLYALQSNDGNDLFASIIGLTGKGGGGHGLAVIWETDPR